MSLPEVLHNDSCEFYVVDGHIHALIKGKNYSWDSVPSETKNKIQTDLHNNPSALRLLKSYDPEERLRIYTACKFGGFNLTPDIDIDGKISAEHWDCNCDNCPLSDIFP